LRPKLPSYVAIRRSVHFARANKKDNDDDTEDSKFSPREGAVSSEEEARHRSEKTKKDELTIALEAQGMTSSDAKKTLQDWTSLGIKSADDLRKILVKRSVASVVGLSLRLGFDVVATLVVWNAGDAFNHGDGLSNGVLGVLSYGLALNYGINAIFGAFLLVSVLASGNLFGADATALMKAVKDLAGEGEDMEIVAKAKQAANMIKVVQSLSKVSSLLSEKIGNPDEASSKLSSLERLSAYLTLQKAERDYGFDSSKHNITNAQALMLAANFARFDVNDDGALELSEVQKMFDSVGEGDMTTEEMQAAIDLLDRRGSGLVEFDEFVAWYASPKTSSSIISKE